MASEKVVTCYYGMLSPFAYLGMPRLREICRRHGAEIVYKPTNIAEVFKASGGLPLDQRPAQRKKYRLVELKRWSKYLGMPLNLEPKYFPADPTPSALMVQAAIRLRHDPASLSFAYQRAAWAEERNIADTETAIRIADEEGFRGAELYALSQTAEIKTMYARNTAEAIELDIFGSPTYVYKNELFWGQDRLDFLDRALAKND